MDIPNIVPTSADLNLTHLHETLRTMCGRGLHVFPLAPGRKTPVTTNGFKDATSDVTTALTRFSYGRLNIGVATGMSKLVVVDGDGEAGDVWLANAQDTYGIPPTFTVRTRSGGYHYYFQAPEGIEVKCSASKVAPGIDIRAEGGYVVGPTSWVDADKKGPAGWYRVIDDSPAAPLPDWLRLLLLASQERTASKTQSTAARQKRTNYETPRNIAALKTLLAYIDADCDYDRYRSVVWSVLSTGWACAEDMARNWSLTAPERFEQRKLDALINTYDPKRCSSPSYGTIVYLARQGGYRG